MLRVIDLSDAQAGLDLSIIANQFDAVMIKATGGNGYVNPYCDGWVQQAIALGKKWGVYHYFSDGYNDSDPIAEANWFVDNCLGYVGKGILGFDWERGGNPDVNNPGKALQWLQQVEARTAVKPIEYMSLSLITGLDWSSVVANNNGLWCADYVEDNTPITNFGMDSNRDPNPHWDGQTNDVMWQFTSTGRLDGYTGNLDCSFFYGTAASWDAYAGVHTASAPQPDPTPIETQPETPSEPIQAPTPTPDPVETLPIDQTPTPTIPTEPDSGQTGNEIPPVSQPVVVTTPSKRGWLIKAIIAFLEKLFNVKKG